MAARRAFAALTTSFILLAVAPATAQMRAATLVGPFGPSAFQAEPSAPEFRMGLEDLSWPGEPSRNGLLAALPIDRNFEIGVGRFRVQDPARPRTHTEFERQPMSVRPRERGIAAVGVSFRF